MPSVFRAAPVVHLCSICAPRATGSPGVRAVGDICCHLHLGLAAGSLGTPGVRGTCGVICFLGRPLTAWGSSCRGYVLSFALSQFQQLLKFDFEGTCAFPKKLRTATFSSSCQSPPPHLSRCPPSLDRFSIPHLDQNACSAVTFFVNTIIQCLTYLGICLHEL